MQVHVELCAELHKMARLLIGIGQLQVRHVWKITKITSVDSITVSRDDESRDVAIVSVDYIELTT